jgi:membrane-bound lytic murein transglycosylase F
MGSDNNSKNAPTTRVQLMQSIRPNLNAFLAACLMCCSGLFTQCTTEQTQIDQVTETTFNQDLDEIRNHGKLRALMVYSATSYFLYRGEPMGFEYEMLERFAKHLNLELEITVSNDLDSLADMLHSGQIDIVAHGLTVTTDRMDELAFTDHLYLVKQVLVQRKPKNWRNLSWSRIDKAFIQDPIELIGDTVSVRKNSSYMKRLQNLSLEIGGEIFIDTLPGSLSTDEIIKMVEEGKIKYTVADDNIANINASYYPSLDVSVPISFSQRIAWALRPESKELLHVANQWIASQKKETDYYVIFNRYFKNTRGFKKRSESAYYSLNDNRISIYDDIVKASSEDLGWDWRLLSALIYQESQFEPRAQSWTEAAGLMQIMPSTAEDLGISDPNDPVESIRGGVRYLKEIWSNFNEIPDSLERIKFTLASYNCGLGHVFDAQRLAEKNGLAPNIWTGNVAEIMLHMGKQEYYTDDVVRHGYVRGTETYAYVEEIMTRYDHYCKFIAKDA